MSSNRRIVSIALTVLTSVLVSGCATSAPSTKEYPYPNQKKAELLNHVVKSLSLAGYEIKDKDENAGVVQALKPIGGAFGKPGYGHKVTVLIEDNHIKVTVFPAEGVLGGPSVEDVQNEVSRLLGAARG